MSISEAERFYEDVMPYCEYDPHVSETKSYEIASVYYDTDDLRFYYDREESVGYRRKIRLRAYVSERKATALFIEIKEKHNQYVAKKRINLKNMDILDIGVRHDELPLDAVIEELEDSAEAREIAYLQKRLQLYPVVNIRYHRRPLIPKFEDDMRITLDTRITAGGASLSDYDEKTEQPIIDIDKGVLEIKTNKTVPTWLQTALIHYQMSQTRYSKYCLGVDKIYGRAGKDWYPKTNKVVEEDDDTHIDNGEPEKLRAAG